MTDVYLRVADVMETQVPVLRPDQTELMRIKAGVELDLPHSW